MAIRISLRPTILGNNIIHRMQMLLRRLRRLLLRFLILTRQLFTISIIPNSIISVQRQCVLTTMSVKRTTMIYLNIIQSNITNRLRSLPTRISSMTTLKYATNNLSISTRRYALSELTNMHRTRHITITTSLTRSKHNNTLLRLTSNNTNINVKRTTQGHHKHRITRTYLTGLITRITITVNRITRNNGIRTKITLNNGMLNLRRLRNLFTFLAFKFRNTIVTVSGRKSGQLTLMFRYLQGIRELLLKQTTSHNSITLDCNRVVICRKRLLTPHPKRLRCPD